MGTLEIKLPLDFKKRCQDYILARTKPKHSQVRGAPEEQVNNAIWWVLQKIRKEELLQENDKPVEITFQSGHLVIGTGLPPIEVRQKVLLKVQELGGIKIINNQTYNDAYGVDFVYIVQIIQPKFDELYEKYQELNQKLSTEKQKQEIIVTTEQIEGQVVGELNLSGYSEDNLRRFGKIVSIILSQIELDGWRMFTNIVKIPFITLKREGFSYEEMGSILGSINKINDKKVIAILNKKPYEKLKSEVNFPWFDDISKRHKEIRKRELLEDWLSIEGRVINVSEDDLKNKLILQLSVGGTKENVIGSLSSWRKNIQEVVEGKSVQTQPDSPKLPAGLKSIHLITNSLEPANAIFLVLDKQFQMPIRFAVKNKDGDPAYIKRLYDIAYFVDAPNKKVDYDRNIADGINNGLFKKGAVKKYMKTNGLNKPTLVQKSENKTLVLKNEITVKTGLVKNDVPVQHQSFYVDKTR